jgi:6-pyruvoyltetrahydropterin/6-carboxytetrahydropterin synthase
MDRELPIHPTRIWTLSKAFRFEASHVLTHHDGKCARLHGHSWNGEVFVAGSVLHTDGPRKNMLIDYADLKAVLRIIEDELDHRHLNDVLGTDSPTSEFVAAWVFHRIGQLSVPIGSMLSAVSIDETCTSSCIYQEMQPDEEA